ncbi:hypothetical protein [Botryobacter ruber]|uniref:hypothetical protein n=1 Tax=Botryobacter ruber TaxID=2171629 RepID=UPI000F64DBB5|nr:hypothetical protein [Botryobacter ruber]
MSTRNAGEGATSQFHVQTERKNTCTPAFFLKKLFFYHLPDENLQARIYEIITLTTNLTFSTHLPDSQVLTDTKSGFKIPGIAKTKITYS